MSFSILDNVQTIIGTACCADAKELDEAVAKLRKEIGTGYYEGRGDSLFEFVATWIDNLYVDRPSETDRNHR